MGLLNRRRGHVNRDPAATVRDGHASHPHFLRLTPEGFAAAKDAS